MHSFGSADSTHAPTPSKTVNVTAAFSFEVNRRLYINNQPLSLRYRVRAIASHEAEETTVIFVDPKRPRLS